MDHNGIDRLRIEYIADSHIETVGGDIYRSLPGMPQISSLLESGDVFLGHILQDQGSAPTHTLKRTILR